MQLTVGINRCFNAVYTVLYPVFIFAVFNGVQIDNNYLLIIIKYFQTLKLFRIFAK